MMRLRISGNILFFTLIMGLAMLAGPVKVMALGMGEINLKSALNQPFNAVVELSSATDAELTELQIKVAPREMFTRKGLGWTRVLSDLQFKAERTASGTPVIRITSKEPVSEPFLEIMLEIVWSRGHLIRTYTVLIDPPLTMPATPVATAMPLIQKPTPTPVPVSESPAPAPPKTRTVKPTAAPKTDLLPSPSPRPPAESQVDHYGPVKRNETLWHIAKKIRPDSSVGINQTMIAILRANPDAFFNGNINNLKTGSVLRVPDRNEITSLGNAARSEVSRQYAEWKANREQKKVVEAEPSTEAVAVPDQEVRETRLQLVAPQEGEVEAESGVSPGNEPGTDEAEVASDELQQQLALANEEVESGQAQTGEFQSRVNDLEAQLEQMQRLLELKDEQLAGLQNRLGIELEELQPDAIDEVLTGDFVTTDEASADAENEPVVEDVAADESLNEPQGLVAKVIDNPVLSALIVIVAMVLGGFLFASVRQRRESSLFSDEITLASRLEIDAKETNDESKSKAAVSKKAEKNDPGIMDGLIEDDGDDSPATEADVFLAYGRTQQAETVLLSALAASPEDLMVRMKLLEVYHAAGDAPAFDDHFNKLQHTGAVDPEAMQKIMRMGHELSPQNQNYNEVLSSEDGNFDMDAQSAAAQGGSDDNESGLGLADGVRNNEDKIGAKLDLARAYRDMGDTESACRMLEEVLEEGNDGQKEEARALLDEHS